MARTQETERLQTEYGVARLTDAIAAGRHRTSGGAATGFEVFLS
jgi:hypothetical protein